MTDRQEIIIEDNESGFGAYLIINEPDRGLSFGGTRICTSVTYDMVVELAANMSSKLAVHGSPVGGAKAGLRASPNDPRLKEFLHRFANECSEHLTKSVILGKDLGAKQWMLEEMYSSLQMSQLDLAQRQSSPALCPEQICDLSGYVKHMTGKGVFWALEQAIDGPLRGARVLIQGFGMVGSGVAWHLDQAGAKVVGVSDCQKAIINFDGLDLNSLMAAKDDAGLIVEGDLQLDSCVVTERDDLLTQCADVLVLAAGSYLVDGDTAEQIQTPLVVEGANLGLLPDARKTLHANAVRVVPDVVANSSSAALVGSQIASGNTREPQALWAEIEANIKRATDVVEQLSMLHDVDSKSAMQWFSEADSTSLLEAEN